MRKLLVDQHPPRVVVKDETSVWATTRQLTGAYNSQMPESGSKPFWKAVAFVGVGLVVIGLCALGFDFVTMDQFDLSRYYEVFILAILIGVPCLIVGLIRWTNGLGRDRRISVGAIVLLASMVICLLGYLIGGPNAHGPFYFFFLPMVPVGLVGLIILLMGVASHSQ
jgi:phosphatidylserine synthase